MTADSPRDYAKLAHHVVSRRSEMKLSRLDAAQQADMSKDTWLRVERSGSVREGTYARIEKVLKWAPGSCQAILGGDSPVTVEPGPTPGTVLAAIPEDDLRKDIVGAMVAVTDELTAAQIREISQRIVEELRKRGTI
ncbi:hypothetical protein [Streptomyces smyrnaeus]|uniref:hypothetical protein n=1 Tax=Streptomyces smyrnaeus TaxID=1387713 RepID=UPI00340BFB1C